MQWFRYYHETPTDPKWRAVAIEAGVPVHAVLAVWDCMMVNASESSARGTLEGWNHRVTGAAIDLKAADVEAIYNAMQGLTLDGDHLTGWGKRQRCSDDVAARVKQHRERTKQERNVTPAEGNVTGTDFPLRAQTPDSEHIQIPPPPSADTSVRVKGADGAAAVANRFLELREERWPNDTRFPAPLITLRTEAQQFLDSGGTVELLGEVLERGMATWKSPSPPRSLRAFAESVADRVAEFKRASEQPVARPANKSVAIMAPGIIDRMTRIRGRLRLYRDTGKWDYGSDPAPTHPRCGIPLKVLEEELGQDFVDKHHRGAA
ncbi:hypothetical protein [Azospirillum brasilense]|uniref:hypothetical protein n=1 Tax=Azospirillum brasilense TaxID=192 RepID=UPI001EDA9C75|nr:hypothetical protein [Azospirillum brasilense]UKJ74250.1 hypothetical protein H1Q64_06605 [Azospirillum brasilense]